MRRKNSAKLQFRKRIPAAYLQAARGKRFAISFPSDGAAAGFTVEPIIGVEVTFSLRTDDARIAKRRQAIASEALERFLETLEAVPEPLSHRERLAIAGAAYSALMRDHEDDPGDPGGALVAGWEALMGDLQEGLRYFDPEADGSDGPAYNPKLGAAYLEPVVKLDGLLTSLSLPQPLPEDRPLLLRDVADAQYRACQTLLRRVAGDYGEDANPKQFPQLEVPTRKTSAPPAAVNGLSMTALLEGWWAEAQKAGTKLATYQNYRGAVRALVAHLGHEEALRVTPADVVAFKTHRLETVSAKTVRDVDLPALRTVFKWAVSNRMLGTNPAHGVSVERIKQPKLRSKGFSDAEACALLSAASSHQAGPAESAQMAAAKRWVPWVLAYTGARVGEVAQLRKEDLRLEDDRWIMRITPEAGPVKTDEARDVVLHRHLEELGFIAFVEASGPGYLFLTAKGLSTVQAPLTTLKNRLREFAREVVTDPNVAPNHGWRHRFKTVGMQAGIDHRILDAIQGQRGRVVAEAYGDVTPVTQARAIDRLPLIVIAPKTTVEATSVCDVSNST